MYTIKCGNFPLLDLRDEDFILAAPKFKIEANTVHGGSFTIYKKHPNYDKITPISIIELADEFGVVFRGRMTERTLDFINGKAVDLEGVAAFLNDSFIRPFTFPDDFLNDENYIEASTNGNVIEFFLGWLIDQHNSQVEEFQKLKLGNVTVTDPNNYLSRSNSDYASTWATIESKLFKSALGGYICVRYEADGTYIDYVDKFQLTNTQKIEYGQNMLDLSNNTDFTATFSAIIPIGGEVEETTKNEDGTTTTTKRKITLADLTEAEKSVLPDDLCVEGEVLYSKSAVAAYGWKVAPTKDTTFDDVFEAKNLLTKGVVSLTAGALATNTIEIQAVDMHISDAEIRSFRACRNVVVYSKPHGLEDVYMLSKLDIEVLKPGNTKITVGKTQATLTDANRQQQLEVNYQAEKTNKQISEVYKKIEMSTTKILADSEKILLEALKSYVETSTYEQFETLVLAQFQVVAEQISGSVTELTKQIENVDGDLQEKFNEITKYFTFDINGLTIGQVDNPYKVVIDNDEICIKVNDVDVQKFDAEGNALIPHLTVTKKINMFGYQFDEDDEGRVNCEYVGG